LNLSQRLGSYYSTARADAATRNHEDVLLVDVSNPPVTAGGHIIAQAPVRGAPTGLARASPTELTVSRRALPHSLNSAHPVRAVGAFAGTDTLRAGAPSPAAAGLRARRLLTASAVGNRTRGDGMIVVVGRVRTDAEKRDGLIRIGQAVAAASRGEVGCINYRVYEDTEDENEFVFVEEWEDEAALQRHFATPHIGTFMREIPATLVAPPDVKFHTVASSRDLADVSTS
jgi:quinol monooxygenase YgiN